MNRVNLLFAGALMLSGCAQTAVEAKRDEMQKYLAQCTERFGYDPRRTETIDEHQLAPGERQWRSCAYAGVQTILIPNAANPKALERLVLVDMQMTNDVERGQLTRSERRSRLEAMLQQITSNEQQAQRARDLERLRAAQAQQEQFDRMSTIRSQAALDAQLAAIRAGMR